MKLAADRATNTKDFIEKYTVALDYIGIFTVPGLSGLIISRSVHQDNLQSLTTISSSLLILSGICVIIIGHVRSYSTRFGPLRALKVIKWLGATMTILNLAVISATISSYIKDKDGILAPFTTILLLVSLFACLWGAINTYFAALDLKAIDDSNDDSYKKAEPPTSLKDFQGKYRVRLFKSKPTLRQSR